MQLLLLSNSYTPGVGLWLDWANDYLADFIKRNNIKSGIFIPYAGVSITHDEYTVKLSNKLSQFGVVIKSVTNGDVLENIKNAHSVWCGGGNTWVLLKTLQDIEILDSLKERIENGLPYVGWSAGTNIACPTIKTTNDMPIVEPKSFKAMNLLPFQINPHYLDAIAFRHGGETREERIKEFLIANPMVKVAGLREGLLFDINGDLSTMKLKGIKGRTLRVFEARKDAFELSVGSDVSLFL